MAARTCAASRFCSPPFYSGAAVSGAGLGLVALVLTGNLILLAIFSGSENFVSRFDEIGHDLDAHG